MSDRYVLHLGDLLELTDDFVELERRFPDYTLSYEEIMKCIIMAASTSESFSLSSIHEAITKIHTYEHSEPSYEVDKLISENAAVIYRWRTLRKMFPRIRRMVMGISHGYMLEPNMISIRADSEYFMVRL